MAKFVRWKLNKHIAALRTQAGEGLVIDHRHVDLYANIPQSYIDIVKVWLYDTAGESHNTGYRQGCTLLEYLNPAYECFPLNGGMEYSEPGNGLRVGGHDSVGEEDFFTNETAKQTIESVITWYETNNRPIHVLSFGWCNDMIGGGLVGGRDPVYDVSWGGNSIDGPEGNLGWGLDAEDTALTGNSICMDSYLATVERYNAFAQSNGYACRTVFTTGPVDSLPGTEYAFQREVKHAYIRNYVQNHPSAILFDYADILCHNNSGEHYIVNWDDGGTIRPHAHIHPDNMYNYTDPANGDWTLTDFVDDGSHTGNVGTLRLGKAIWYMLARMAGWNGI